jgi:hypothetical protein
MKLSKDYIDVIRYRIDQSEITMHTLKDDVLDHVCCVVEQKIKEGKSFEIALQEAFHEVAPNGLDEIQRKTFYLLKSPKIIFMKKVMYFTGLICAVTVSVGWLFATLHWSGANEIFNMGFLGFLWVFVPMLVVDRFRIRMRKPVAEKIKILLGAASGFTVGLSLVFKLLHLQGADVVLIAGMLMFMFGFLPIFFFTLYKKAVDSSNLKYEG